jgi:hypothetical protein
MGKSGSTTVTVWTVQEQTIAREAFSAAQQRAVASLIGLVRHHVSELESMDSLWQLHDFLSIQRHSMEGRFDFRLEGILFVFASLVKDELLGIEELTGLEPEKLAKIRAMSQF